MSWEQKFIDFMKTGKHFNQSESDPTSDFRHHD